MKVSNLISTITIASALCLSLTNALVFSPCDKIQSLVKEYFDETIVDEMMCIAYNEAINPKSDSIGLWNLKKEHCNTVCKSICNSEIDLADIKLNTQCAEMVYLEFGFNGWDSYNNGLCKDSWGFCNTQNELRQHGSHSSTSRDSSSSSSRDSTGTGYSSSGSGTSGSGSNSGQTGHFIPGQSGHGLN
ncbi:lysozyme C family protein [Dictyostelium discoideum AX4]|uniref:Lysozyme C-like protein DDB_G0288143 n=1 Tax=Dictyostelium discoideum TaxID=44689 RepID=Y8143_DICDI|nr:lysozyme C family protein [Dictyostelium discoideum AX4]Q54JC9.1 RecName: Full=Lysozyme C-like protein DDB_G0288143; Flags: Precursor [Dictyostelium discoideum]EAL63359.1 lysozyme C family protein [Dictyostelium discoideum AX4]|eukprot:XP_636864.1 lysozyme C family protein [Dictyostelium discoideum AX4]